jgi:hypothetical protein
MMDFLGGFVRIVVQGKMLGLAGLFQDRHLARGINQRQLVRKSFLFSHCDYAILFFLCFDLVS